MQSTSHEIRVCESCGLRYPLAEGHTFGTRCPACMGETRVVFRRVLSHELESSSPHRRMNVERKKGLAVLIDNIRSAWNLGSILRSADGFGFGHAYLCGITPLADDNAVKKTSLGAEQSVRWSYHKDGVQLVTELRSKGWRVYGLEEHEEAMPLDNLASARRESRGSSEKELLILGNEVTGVDPGLLELCDGVFYIPMRGEKKSFNVAIAFGIAAYALTADDS